MVEDRVPAFDELMQPLLDALKQLGGAGTLNSMRRQVATLLGLSDAQLAVPHKPNSTDRRSKFDYNLAWTCTYLKNAGYIENIARGTWALTEQGNSAESLDIERIKRDVRTYNSGRNGASVTVPSPQDEVYDKDDEDRNIIETNEEVNNLHTQIQWLLLKLGQDMNLDVWVATNDRSKQFDGNRFDIQPKLLKRLPQRFPEATQRTVELIDVLWWKGQAVVAAFEIENTSSIYSGLLRLSDLTAMQPDLPTPLYIVAPDERERKVILEINRPTFSIATNLAQKCRYISYSSLHKAVEKAEGLVSYLSPTFIAEFSQNVTHIDL
jgi:hypothetical protein